jgi:hypothetical protein
VKIGLITVEYGDVCPDRPDSSRENEEEKYDRPIKSLYDVNRSHDLITAWMSRNLSHDRPDNCMDIEVYVRVPSD